MIPGIVSSIRRSGGVIPVPAELISMAVASKLLSWWDFDGDATDAMGLNNLSGAATYSPGLIGQKATKGARLTRTSAVMPPALNITDGVGGLSIAGWVYVAGTGAEDIEVRTSAGQAYRLAVRNGNQAHFIVGASGPITISTTVGALSLGTWNLLVGTINPANRAMQLYLNGALVATGTATTSASPTDISFGTVSGNVFTALENDSSGIYAGVLSAQEIAWLYNDGAGRGSAGLPFAPAGVWTWFNDPRVILLPTGTMLWGAVETDGTLTASWTEDGGLTGGSLSFTGASTPDDHDNPVFLRRSDGKLLAFYCRHNDANTWIRESVNADDPSAWGSAVNLQPQMGAGPYSYSNPVQLTGEPNEPIYNFFRRGSTPNWTMHYSKSEDGGTTWAPYTALLSGGRPYFKVARNGTTRIDFAVTDGHPDATPTNSIRHFYYEGGAFFDSAGNPLGAPPFPTTTALTTVYDGSTNRAWIHDLKIGSDGHPRVVFAVFNSSADHRYFYGRWTGAAWVTSQICTAGGRLYAAESYYSGGVCLDADNPNIVYASRGMGGGRWALYRYETADGGSSFDETDMGVDGIRPFHVAGAGVVAAINGRYATFANFRTRVALFGSE